MPRRRLTSNTCRSIWSARWPVTTTTSSNPACRAPARARSTRLIPTSSTSGFGLASERSRDPRPLASTTSRVGCMAGSTSLRGYPGRRGTRGGGPGVMSGRGDDSGLAARDGGGLERREFPLDRDGELAEIAVPAVGRARCRAAWETFDVILYFDVLHRFEALTLLRVLGEGLAHAGRTISRPMPSRTLRHGARAPPRSSPVAPSPRRRA